LGAALLGTPHECLQSLLGGRREVLVSAPERALSELLSHVGKAQSLDEARHAERVDLSVTQSNGEMGLI
jgi:hypothetical protein